MALTITYPTDVIRRRLQVQIVTNRMIPIYGKNKGGPI
jgi:hypothetical protein